MVVQKGGDFSILQLRPSYQCSSENPKLYPEDAVCAAGSAMMFIEELLRLLCIWITMYQFQKVLEGNYEKLSFGQWISHDGSDSGILVQLGSGGACRR
jgi:hypothetical protein